MRLHMSNSAELVMEQESVSQSQQSVAASSSSQPSVSSQSPSSSSSSVQINKVGHTAMSGPSAANITYDKLFEILRIERTDANLQKLPLTFFGDVRAYLQLKQDSIEKSKNSTDLFAAEHVETAQQQIRNATRILTDIYDRRERKIMNLALNKAKAVSHPIDTSHLLAEEKALFTQIISMLAAQRSTVQQLLTSSVVAQIANSAPASLPITIAPVVQASMAVESAAAILASEKKYEVIGEISEFFGPDMQHYGPFAVGDMATFSDQIARILLKKNLVKQI